MNIIAQAMQDACNRDLIQQPMVYKLWQDGEITLEKGGDLYGQRNLHMVGRPIINAARAEAISIALGGDGGNIGIPMARDDVYRILEMMVKGAEL